MRIIAAMMLVSMMLILPACSREEIAEGEVIPGQAREAEIVQASVRQGYEAVYSGDFEAIVELTHPVIISGLGGRDAARQSVAEAMEPILAEGMRIQELTFPRPPRFVIGETNQFVMVPTRAIIVMRGQSVESVNYWFGARRIGATEWKYIEGSRINRRNVRQFFPDFPAGVELPECSRRRL